MSCQNVVAQPSAVKFVPLTISENTAVIHLSMGLRALVDTEDWEWLSQWKWSAFNRGKYAYRNENAKGHFFLHRSVMNAPSGVWVDHINGKGLDCRKSNLRLCNPKENARNARPYGKTSPYKGVYRIGKSNRWKAAIYYDGKQRHLGRFSTAEEAAHAYDAAAREHFGEFAYLNFPDEAEAA